MLARIGALRAEGRIRSKPGRGVLVKAPKQGQDLRVDMPTIGPNTVAGVGQAQLGGIAVEAGGVLVADQAGLASQVVEAGLFVTGIRT